MVPDDELSLLCDTVADAFQAASRGDVTTGYHTLLQGLARAHEASRAGHAWAGTLVASYETARDRFVEQHGTPGIRLPAGGHTASGCKPGDPGTPGDAQRDGRRATGE